MTSRARRRIMAMLPEPLSFLLRAVSSRKETSSSSAGCSRCPIGRVRSPAGPPVSAPRTARSTSSPRLCPRMFYGWPRHGQKPSGRGLHAALPELCSKRRLPVRVSVRLLPISSESALGCASGSVPKLARASDRTRVLVGLDRKAPVTAARVDCGNRAAIAVQGIGGHHLPL